MTCEACTTARANRYSGLYHSACFGCEMRAFARSTLAFEAVRDRSTAALRDALALSHKSVPVETALAAIWEWWRGDHEQETAASAA